MSGLHTVWHVTIPTDLVLRVARADDHALKYTQGIADFIQLQRIFAEVIEANTRRPEKDGE